MLGSCGMLQLKHLDEARHWRWFGASWSVHVGVEMGMYGGCSGSCIRKEEGRLELACLHGEELKGSWRSWGKKEKRKTKEKLGT